MTGTRAKGIIAICWVLSFAIGLTPMLGWNNCTQQESRNSSQVCGEGQAIRGCGVVLGTAPANQPHPQGARLPDSSRLCATTHSTKIYGARAWCQQHCAWPQGTR